MGMLKIWEIHLEGNYYVTHLVREVQAEFECHNEEVANDELEECPYIDIQSAMQNVESLSIGQEIEIEPYKIVCSQMHSDRYKSLGEFCGW